jgi:hypothetical protein
MDSIMLPHDFSVKDVSYGAPRTLDNGGKSIYLAFNKAPIVLQTPLMRAPFGKQKWENDKGTSKFTLDLSFAGMDARPALEDFYKRMTDLDNKLVDDGVTNSFDWLKKKNVSRDVVKELYTKLVRHHTDKATGELTGKYPPTFKLTLPYKDGAFTCEVYDNNKKQVDLNVLETKGASVTAIIQCLGIWVVGGKYGCTWKVLQMKVVPPPTIKGYAFKEIENDKVEDDEVDEEDEKEVDDDDDLLDPSHVDPKDDDDDDVVDSSDDDLETKKPEPVKVKKPIVAKKK